MIGPKPALVLAIACLLAVPAAAQIDPGGKGGGPTGGGGPTSGGPLPDQELVAHVLGRLTWGPTGEDFALLRGLGVDGWIRYQLRPDLIAESSELAARLALLPPATTPLGDPQWVWQSLYADYLLRARYSRRQLNEVMTEFWSNHFDTALDYANGGHTGYFSSLAYTPDGRLAMAYWDGHNRMPHVSIRGGTSWSRYAADYFHPSGLFASLGADPLSGQPAVAYYEQLDGPGTGNLRFSRFDGSTWTAEVVDSDGDTGRWASLAFGRDGEPRIAYRDETSGSLRLARHGPAGWTIETVATGDVGHSASLALDAADRPLIAHYDRAGQRLALSRWNGSAWSGETITGLPAAGIDWAATPAPPRLLALGLDPATGQPVVAYYDSAGRDLGVARWDGSRWQTTIVDSTGDVGSYPALAFDPAGQPAVAYHDRDRYALKLARSSGAAWTVETVDSGGHIAGEWSALAFSATGTPAISYYDGSIFSAVLAEKPAATWVTTVVETLGTIRFVNTVWEKNETDRFRARALGRFRDLLAASATSPAMMEYLNNIANRAGAGNENWARELLELHTLGVDGGYTQTDVETVARAFTGWSTDRAQTRCDVRDQGFCYNHAAHDGSAKIILGRTYAADSANLPAMWMKQGNEILDTLARHPSTARFVCRKLVQKFVADLPPPEVWNACAATFLNSDGDISRVLETIFFHPDFRNPAGFRGLVKTPVEYTLSAVRGTEAPSDGLSLYDSILWQGVELFRWTVPTGYPETGATWVSPNSLLQRWQFADRLLNGTSGTVADPAALVRTAGLTRADAIIAWLLERLVGGRATAGERAALLDLLNAGDPGPIDLADPAARARLNETTQAILGFPAFHKQ